MKSLDDIPEPVEHSERRSVVLRFREASKARGGFFTVFSEAVAMNRDDKCKYLAEVHGYGEDMLKSAPDELVDQMYERHKAMEEGDTGGDATPQGVMPSAEAGEDQVAALDRGKPPETGMDEEMPPMMTDEGADPGPGHDSAVGGGSNYVDPGADPGDLHPDSGDESTPEGPPALDETVGATGQFDEDMMPDPAEMSEDERTEMADKMAAQWRKYRHYKAAEETMPKEKPAAAPPAPKPAAAMSERAMASLIAAEVGKRVGEAMAKIEKNWNGRIGKLDKFAERRINAERRATADAMFRTAVKAGKVLPSQIPALMPAVMKMDAARAIKFSEKDAKGKTFTAERTEFDNFFHQIMLGPDVAKFAEQAKTGKDNGSPADAEEREIGKIKAHYEQFREIFTKQGTTVEKLVDGFKNMRKSNPNATASQLLGV